MSNDLPLRVRSLREGEEDRVFPLYVVWETTMKCDQPCGHCGTRAGHARPEELSTEEMFTVARALAKLGAREVTLIGGEAYLRTDCEDLIRFITDLGVRVTMQTGGRAFTPERARRFAKAGLGALGVSIDGPAESHDRLRGNSGSYAAAMQALVNARDAGLTISANTQINKLNCDLLLEFSRELRRTGIEAWQVQLTGPLGRAADRPEWIIDPWQIVPIIDTLAAIQKEAVEEFVAGGSKGICFNVFTNNNIGYFGPHEIALRSRPFGRETHWLGCAAGIYILGIESDGTVKACPTLPTAEYAAGNVLDMRLEDLWERAEMMKFSRERTTDELWGFCKTCYYADVCKAGCSWMTHTTLGRRGNNPFCYHRVTQLKRQGVRERLLPIERAPQLPYDHGRFEISLEPWRDDEPNTAPRDRELVPLRRSRSSTS